MIAIHPAPRSILFLRKKNGRIRAAEGEGNGRVWQSCWRASCIFRTACLSTVADSYNKQAFFLTLWYNNIWMNNREICSPRILKHCGAITGALNIRAQHDAAHRFPWLCTPAARPFLHYTSHLAEVNSRSRSTGRRRSQNGPLKLPRASSKTQYGGLKLFEYRVVVEARGGRGGRGQEKCRA